MRYPISMRTCASVKALQDVHHVDKATADKVREVWHTVANRKNAREQIDALIGTHGVEYLGTNKRTGDAVYYCNAGDAYATTVIFQGLHMRVGCWGDLIERNTVREPAQF